MQASDVGDQIEWTGFHGFSSPSQFEIASVLIRFSQALLAGNVQYTAMNAQWIFWSIVFVMGVVVAGGVGYFLIQHEVLTAIFFGFPPTLLSSARFG
jgi:hypothetical protein